MVGSIEMVSKTVHAEPFIFNTITAKKLYDTELPPVTYLIDNLIPEQSLIYLAGPSASFKTGFMINLSLLGACRDEVLGFKVNKPLRVLFIDEENGIRRTKHKFKRILDATDIDIHEELKDDQIIFSTISQFKIQQLHIDGLKLLIEKHKPNLIVIDNIARCFVGSERDEQQVSQIHRLLKPIQEEYGISFVIIHHTRKADTKGKGRKTLDDISGSRDFGAQCDEAFLLEKFRNVDDRTTTFKLIQLKSKDNAEMEGINFDVIGRDDSPLRIEFSGTIRENANEAKFKIQRKIIELFQEEGKDTLTTKVIQGAMEEEGHKRTYILETLKAMVDGGILNRPKRGHYQFFEKYEIPVHKNNEESGGTPLSEIDKHL